MIPPLFKFNHLLNALKGETYHAVIKFQVKCENYLKAMDFFASKYENKEESVVLGSPSMRGHSSTLLFLNYETKVNR